MFYLDSVYKQNINSLGAIILTITIKEISEKDKNNNNKKIRFKNK